MKFKSSTLITATIIAAIIILFSIFIKYYGDWLWFQNLGFSAVFVTMLWAKVFTFLGFFLIFAIIAIVNIAIARKFGRFTRSMKLALPNEPENSLEIIFKENYAKYVWGALILFFAIIMGLSASGSWETFLKFFHASKFGLADPIFHKDVGFYIFRLPLFQFLQGWYLFMIILLLGMVGLSYYLDQSITLKDNKVAIDPKAKYHLSILTGLFLLGIVFVYILKLYEILYSSRGVSYGASYADVHAQIPAYWVLLILTAVVSILFLVSPVIKKWKFIGYAALAYFVSLVIMVWVYPNLVEQYLVKPNELTKETPYILNNIHFTRMAYDLNNVREETFPVEQKLTYQDILNNTSTIHNIRLWDRRPLIQTYKQLQEIRLYYNFKNVDVDRYHFQEYTQVALAGRELPSSRIPARAQTWVNVHLKYTHGYGLVMNPVNEVTEEGMPNFIVKNIPPESNGLLNVVRPEIYYGEDTDGYTIVRTKTKEFDYPKGNENIYTTYQGKGGVRISGLFRKLVYAWKFSDIKILLTGYITDQSRLMFHRIITDRDRTVAPFLSYDSDPYLVVGEDGKLYWIHDAYTTSNMYPYSQPVSQAPGQRGLNYMRNSVKIVTDAYNGNMTFYIKDPSDPIIQTFGKIFPTLFRPFDEMPDFLKKHIRYPTDLFTIQADLYNVYHMTDPQVFYNQEDYWNIPHEIYQNTEQPMFPYYIIMKLPKGKSEEFILMLPLTPSKKNNMVAWMCARCDAPNYGQLIVYQLPKEKLIFGPMQIEARINQKPEISSELTLWGQKGSSVIRGNLLIIPVEHSFIYVEPIYLESEQSQLPELKRVVGAYGDQLEMRANLEQALRAVFSMENVPKGQTKGALTGAPVAHISTLAQKALSHYNQALNYLKQGNWGKYGEELDQLHQILQTMSQKK